MGKKNKARDRRRRRRARDKADFAAILADDGSFAIARVHEDIRRENVASDASAIARHVNASGDRLPGAPVRIGGLPPGAFINERPDLRLEELQRLMDRHWQSLRHSRLTREEPKMKPNESMPMADLDPAKIEQAFKQATMDAIQVHECCMANIRQPGQHGPYCSQRSLRAAIGAAAASIASPELRTLLETLLEEVAAERARQDAEFGGASNDDQHTPNDWRAFIIKQLALAKSVAPALWRKHMVAVAALALAAVESSERLIPHAKVEALECTYGCELLAASVPSRTCPAHGEQSWPLATCKYDGRRFRVQPGTQGDYCSGFCAEEHRG